MSKNWFGGHQRPVSQPLFQTNPVWYAVPSMPRTMSDASSLDAAMHEAVPAIAALGVSPIVRIPDLQPWMVKRQ